MARFNPLAAMKQLGRHLVAGSVFMVGALLTVMVAYAFQNPTASPGDPGFQSGAAFMLSKAAGTFDREQHSLQAISEKVADIANGGVRGMMVGYGTTNTMSNVAGTKSITCNNLVSPALCQTSKIEFYATNSYGLNDESTDCTCNVGETFTECAARHEAGTTAFCVPKRVVCPVGYQSVTMDQSSSTFMGWTTEARATTCMKQ